MKIFIFSNQIFDRIKTKYLVPFDLTVGQFMLVLRKRMKLPSEQAIFLFVDGIIPSSNVLVQDLYHQHRDLDVFYMWDTRVKIRMEISEKPIYKIYLQNLTT